MSIESNFIEKILLKYSSKILQLILPNILYQCIWHTCFLHNIHIFFIFFSPLKNICLPSFLSIPTVLSYPFQYSILFPSWATTCLISPTLMNIQAASVCIIHDTTKNNLSHKSLHMCANISIAQIPSNSSARSKKLCIFQVCFLYIVNWAYRQFASPLILSSHLWE